MYQCDIDLVNTLRSEADLICIESEYMAELLRKAADRLVRLNREHEMDNPPLLGGLSCTA